MFGNGGDCDWQKRYGVLVDSLTTLARGEGKRAEIFGKLLDKFYWDDLSENRRRTGFTTEQLIVIYEGLQRDTIMGRNVHIST